MPKRFESDEERRAYSRAHYSSRTPQQRARFKQTREAYRERLRAARNERRRAAMSDDDREREDLQARLDSILSHGFDEGAFQKSLKARRLGVLSGPLVDALRDAWKFDLVRSILRGLRKRGVADHKMWMLMRRVEAFAIKDAYGVDEGDYFGANGVAAARGEELPYPELIGHTPGDYNQNAHVYAHFQYCQANGIQWGVGRSYFSYRKWRTTGNSWWYGDERVS